MHELPDHIVATLREQGVTDAEIDELRRTGSIARSDGATTFSLSASSMNAAQIPPEALEQLKQFHQFVPDSALTQLETMSGQDLDGDGVIGAPGVTPDTRSQGMPTALQNSTARHAHHNVSGAMPGSGPFVQKRSTGMSLLWCVAFVAIGGAIAFVFLR